MKSFLLPDLGEGLTEASVVNWLVAEGDTIKIDQPVVEVESAKAVVELPAPFAGVVAKLHAAVGETIQLGDPVISVADESASAPEAVEGPESASAPEPVEGPESASAPEPVEGPEPASVPGRVEGPSRGGAPTLRQAQGSAQAAQGSAQAAQGSAQAAQGSALASPSHRPEHAPTPDDSAVHAGSGAVLVGYGTTTETTRLARPAGGRFRRRSAASASPASASGPRGGGAAAPAAALIDPTRRSRVVSPLVRRLALDNGFDASHLAPSAPDGVVRREDVEAAIAALTSGRQGADAPAALNASAPTGADTAASTSTSPAPGSDADASGAEGRQSTTVPSAAAAPDDAPSITRIPITGMRAAVSEHLSRSRREVPEATIWLEVDATASLALREELRAETGERFSMASIIGRFAIAALRKYPVLNANISADGREIVQHDAVNLGIAAQTERGLVVPVIHNASELSLRGLRDAIDDIARNHTDGLFPPDRLRGGTFTLNNYGGFGVDGSAPILNHPEVAMLGIGRMLERPWVVGGEIAVRTIVTLTLVFDHRVCDGDVASGFITTVAKAIERPTLAFADL